MTKPLGPVPFVLLACVTWLGGVLGGAALVGVEPVLVPTPTPTIAIVPILPEPSWTLSFSPIVIPTAIPSATLTPGPTLGPPTPAPRATSTTPPVTASPSPSPEPTRRTPPPSPTPSPLPTPDPSPTPAATPTPLPAIALSCANGVDNGGGTGTICDVTIGPDSATVRECHGAAGDPTAACMTTMYIGRVIAVTACDGTANGGGATLRCSVTGVGLGSAPVTLCVGSGAGGTLVELTCTWSGSSSVTVSLCNGSGNGGGALVVCSVRG